MAFELLCMFPNDEDATSFYRGLGPLAELEKSGHIRIRTTKAYSWGELIRAHGLFLQRPFTPGHVEVIKLAKVMGLKVWVDYDDDLMNVPMDNPTFHVYANKGTQDSVRACIELADKVTVSTKALAYLKKDAIVVNNAINLKTFPIHPANTTSNCIVWRGSNSHQKDLSVYRDEIVRVSNETESVMVFMGYFPWFITEGLKDKKYYSIRQIDIFDYHRVLSNKIRPKVLMAPLAFNKFNESKSNIAWLEATHAGALTVAPSLDEWTRPGVYNYKDQDGFRYQLDKAFNAGDSQHIDKLQASREDIEANYSLEKVNQIRMQVIEEICQ